MATLTITTSDLIGAELQALLEKAQDLTPALEQIGLFMVGKVQRAFRDGGFFDDFPPIEWPDTVQPNVPGLAVAISKGGDAKESYLGGRKQPLRDSGHLSRSITHKVSGDEVAIGTNVEYADVQNDGGETSTPNKIPELIRQGNKRVQRALAKVRRKFPAAAKRLETEETITTNVLERPFLIITDGMMEAANNIVIDYLMGESPF